MRLEWGYPNWSFGQSKKANEIVQRKHPNKKMLFAMQDCNSVCIEGNMESGENWKKF